MVPGSAWSSGGQGDHQAPAHPPKSGLSEVVSSGHQPGWATAARWTASAQPPTTPSWECTPPTGNGGGNRGGTVTKNGGRDQVRTAAARNGAAGRGARAQVPQDDATQSGPALWLQLTTFVLALAGLGVSIYLTIAHFTESTLAGCSESGLVNCTKVTTSPRLTCSDPGGGARAGLLPVRGGDHEPVGVAGGPARDPPDLDGVRGGRHRLRALPDLRRAVHHREHLPVLHQRARHHVRAVRADRGRGRGLGLQAWRGVDASYAVIGPYLAEVWPNRLRASGMGFSYGIGNLGKIIGPLGLALIVGSSNYVSPKVTLDAIFPALLFLAFWYGQAGLVFAFLGIETKGRSIEEISSSLDAKSPGRERWRRGPRRRNPRRVRPAALRCSGARRFR